ncbi:MAG: C10 family peptidase [Bacteroidales bacterium]|nr:C10 family peptidase [Bacteroidales bacterium]
MKKILVIALIMCIAHLQAQVRIGEREAFSTAERFLQENTRLQNPTMALSETINSKQSDQTNLYVFSIEPKGFVIVSALGDILAYSLVSIMPSSSAIPNHVSYWLDLYNEATDNLFEHPEQRKRPTRCQTTVEPLLTSCWGQGCYHNEACPVDNSGPCQHVEAGCVAIAMAQIMYYHKAPLTGRGEMTYMCAPYGTLTANFGQTTYQWEEMADTLHESNPAVATLVSHCGISVKMKYSSNGSGAYSQSVPEALLLYFYYPAASYVKRINYDDEQWRRIIRNDLDKQHPVYYAGASSLGAHAFVCDGYDGNGMFHFNFGWDGVADGYYTINSPYGFSENQSIIYSIFPIDNIPIHSDSHGIIYVAPDGTGDGSSWIQATSELQLALLKSTMDNSKIWVKEGTYTGNPNDEYAFTPLLGCKLYGGFKGDEPYDFDLSQRDFEAHPSILDGGQTQGVIGEISQNNDLIIIDGFTIQNGSAENGGGILLLCNTQIRNCKFCYNQAQSYGGAISQHYLTMPRTILVEDCEFFANKATSGGAIVDYGSTTFSRCVFHDNYALNEGGGAYCISNGAHSHFFNCTFSNNTARQGGGIAIFTSQGPTLWNCLINNNTAETGGGCYVTKNTDLYNCTIVKNEASDAYGGIYYDTPADIRNCIIWGNTSPDGNIQIGPLQTYTYCAVQDGHTETGNNFSAALENDGNSQEFYVRFSDPEVTSGNTGYGGDWRLQPNSLCIDRGDIITGQPELDLDGNPRLKHVSVDLGSYESNTVVQFLEAIYCEHEPYYYIDSLIPGVGYYSFFYPDITYDSLVVLHMTNPPTTVFYVEKICENETFDFLGTPISEAGVYYKTIDCITHELELSINPLDSVYMHKEICTDETFDFYGTLLKETGTYYDTVDCVAYRLDLNVNPLISHHLEESICEGETYNFFGRYLHDEGHYSELIDCHLYELDLAVSPKPPLHCSNDTIVKRYGPAFLYAYGADSYLWSTGDTTDHIIVYPKENKSYTVTGFSKNGCMNTTSINVTIDHSEEAQSDNQIFIYPNPADDKVEIYAPLIDEVEVFNLYGIRMEQIQAEREAVTLDVSHYTNGVYIIHIRELNNHNYKKLIVSH